MNATRLFVIFALVFFVVACGALSPATAPAQSTQAAPLPQSQPTTSPATLAPSAEPDTPTPEVQQYFTEDFKGDVKHWQTFTINGRTSAITEQQIGGLNLSIQGGRYVFDLPGSNTWAYSFYDAFDYDSVRVDARAENQGSNDNNVTLICRYSKENGWYEFNVANSGLYWIYFAKPNATGYVSYHTVADGGSNNIKQGKEVNDYGMVCNGKTLSLYINGKLTKSATDTQLQSGKIGISVSSFSQAAKVAFDSVKISQP
jgi:hypothetical protein